MAVILFMLAVALPRCFNCVNSLDFSRFHANVQNGIRAGTTGIVDFA
jgi:hypothetical protein